MVCPILRLLHEFVFVRNAGDVIFGLRNLVVGFFLGFEENALFIGHDALGVVELIGQRLIDGIDDANDVFLVHHFFVGEGNVACVLYDTFQFCQ